MDNFAILYIDYRFDKIRELIEKSVLLRQPLHSQSRTGDCRKGKKLLQLNSCNSNSCNLKNHLNRTNSLVLSEFTSKPLQENSFNSNSHNSKNHLNRTNFRSTRRIFHHAIRILVSESSFFILRHSTVVSSNVSIRMP